MPDLLVHGLEFLSLIVEGGGYAILLFTAAKFALRYVAFEWQQLRGAECARRFREIRLELGSHIILAIDFMVISDVIHAGLVRTQESLIAVGIFVLIRSALAFFVGLDMKDVREEESS